VLCHVAARLSGSESKAVKELDSAAAKEDGRVASTLNRTKHWLLSHSQHLNFFTILILASVGFLSAVLPS
jgi:vacuole membrane protein 1